LVQGVPLKKIRIGITIGDPSGIGPEVTFKALKKLFLPKDCQIYLFADKILFDKYGYKQKNINLCNVGALKKIPSKKGPSKESGIASLLYLKEAVAALKKNKINSLVTGPVSKEAISLNGIKFTGHTEFLAKAFSVKNFVMMFTSSKLKVSLVTRHIPFSNVVKSVNKQQIYNTIVLTYKALKEKFNISQPRIAVCAINPHASEGGKIGNQEDKIIKPAIEKARRKIKYLSGPIPADSIFNRAIKEEFDAVVSLYHDQGMIPFKLLSFSDGVNVTLGLPFVRTSCIHGTAFEIAGKNKADYHSMLEAIRLAYRLTKNRMARKYV